MGIKYAAYNPDGAIVGFYDDHDSPVPSSVTAIEITADQWMACLMTPGYSVSGGQLVAPSASALLAQAQANQVGLVQMAYAAAVALPVSFKAANGTTATFAADPASQAALMKAAQGYDLAGSVPTGFYWGAIDGSVVPFTLADLKGLYAVMLAQDWAAMQKLQTAKTAISAATSVSQVQAITL